VRRRREVRGEEKKERGWGEPLLKLDCRHYYRIEQKEEVLCSV
jgi:hypothetical protein